MNTQTLLAALMAASLNITIATSQDKGTDSFVTQVNAVPPVTPSDQTATPVGPADPFVTQVNAVPPATPSDQTATPVGPADPFNPESGMPPEPNISICYEVFSVPLEMAASLQRSQPHDPALYAKLVAALKENEAKQDAFVVIRSKADWQATSDSISEVIYPKSFWGPYSSKAAGSGKDAPPAETGKANAATVPSNPVDFETRNTGTSAAVESRLSEDRQSIDLKVRLQIETMAGRAKWGKDGSEAEVPDFETQRIVTSISARVGQPHLLGTINRPPASSVGPDSTNRVWFAFVTATLPK